MKYNVKFKKGRLVFYIVISIILTSLVATIFILDAKSNSVPGMVTEGGINRADKIYYLVMLSILLLTTFRVARFYSRYKLVYDDNTIEGCIPGKSKKKDTNFSFPLEVISQIQKDKDVLTIEISDGKKYIFRLVKNSKYHFKKLKILVENAKLARNVQV